MGTNSLSHRVVKTFELVGEDGAVEDIIKVDVNIADIASVFDARVKALIESEREIKKAQKRKNTDDFNKAVEVYADAFRLLLELIFGEENTGKLFAFYENRYFDMAGALAPLVRKRIIPAVRNYKKAVKEELKTQFKRV